MSVENTCPLPSLLTIRPHQESVTLTYSTRVAVPAKGNRHHSTVMVRQSWGMR
ncbi:hypothetical protein KIPE111705_07130 [Kibdelosporangium persicum]